MSISRSFSALRGATTVVADEPPAIVAATAELLRELLARNGVAPADVVSVIFTATDDLRSEFPAAAADDAGLGEVPRLCAREIPVEGALPRCIRVLMHVYLGPDYARPQHVYLREARTLRTAPD